MFEVKFNRTPSLIAPESPLPHPATSPWTPFSAASWRQLHDEVAVRQQSLYGLKIAPWRYDRKCLMKLASLWPSFEKRFCSGLRLWMWHLLGRKQVPSLLLRELLKTTNWKTTTKNNYLAICSTLKWHYLEKLVANLYLACSPALRRVQFPVWKRCLVLITPNEVQRSPLERFDSLLENIPILDRPSSHNRTIESAMRNSYERPRLKTQESSESVWVAVCRRKAW
jgi:hypothetical protein